jgi:Zn finger protein HypA/HybF involved in hydrogenase expression
MAMGIVDAVMEESQRRGVQVSAVRLGLGALSGVVKDALLFSYEVACQDTSLLGSQRIVLGVPSSHFFARGVSRSVRCHRSNFSCVPIAARRRWTCVKGKNLGYALWR